VNARGQRQQYNRHLSLRIFVTLAFIIAGLVLAAVGFEIGGAWPYHAGQLLGWLGIGISAVAAIRQAREQRSFEYDFSESDWKPLEGNQFVLEIPKSEHKKGRTPASTTVYQPTDSGGYQKVTGGVYATPSGTVCITVTKPFSGRVVIK
jgi:hypothetical protein